MDDPWITVYYEREHGDGPLCCTCAADVRATGARCRLTRVPNQGQVCEYCHEPIVALMR